MSSGNKFLAIVLVVVLAAALYFANQWWRMRQWQNQYERGVRFHEEKRYVEAAALLIEAYRKRPSSPEGREALFRYCRCLESKGQSDKALEGWRKIISDPRARSFHSPAMLALAREAVDRNRLPDAKRYIAEIVEEMPDTPECGDAYFMRAGILEGENDLHGSMEAARKVVDDYPGSPAVGNAQKKLGELYMKLLFSRRISPDTEEYVVQPGDSLQAIAKRFNSTVELLREMNTQTIKGDSIRPNDRLKVCTAEFSILVDKSANTLTLKAGERIIKVYPVGTGKEGTTPVGKFAVTSKIFEPEWFKPGEGVIPYGDPANLLGTHWLGIDSPGYGIHGTWEPETIGKQMSAGCVRLLNEDIKELYTIVPIGTKVTIVD